VVTNGSGTLSVIFYNHFFFFFGSASNPEPEICPLDGSYTLRGLISPPYISSSRHKRNHNSKQHNSNHHHLHDLSLDSSSSSISSISSKSNFKTHTSLSFRNEEDSLKSWHFNDRNKSLRQRRSLPDTSESVSASAAAAVAAPERWSETDSQSPMASAFNDVSDDGSEVGNIDDDPIIKLVRYKRSSSNSNINNNKRSLESDLESLAAATAATTAINSNDPARSRRDTTISCGGNVNTISRQLAIGCSEENRMEVIPQCSDDGDEG